MSNPRVKIGDRIRLIDMPSDPAPLPAGATGTVSCVSRGNDWEQISVRWDAPHEGRNLMLVEADRFELLDETPANVICCVGWLDTGGISYSGAEFAGVAESYEKLIEAIAAAFDEHLAREDEDREHWQAGHASTSSATRRTPSRSARTSCPSAATCATTTACSGRTCRWEGR